MTSKSLEYRRDLVSALLAKELRVRYKRTVLGYAWSLLNPLAMALIFFVLVTNIFNVAIEKYPLVLVAGLFPWQWMANSTTASAMIFVGSAGLIRRTPFPRGALVVSTALNDMVHFLASIPVIVAVMLWYGMYPDVRWLWWIPLLLIIQWSMLVGIAFFIASCNVFLRDLERLTAIGVTIWFYLTPVIYTRDMLTGRRANLMYLNPAAGIIQAWRSIFMNTPIDIAAVGASAVWAILLITGGYVFFRKVQWRFAELV
jgi:lipopolysaccharide transport system permease protein